MFVKKRSMKESMEKLRKSLKEEDLSIETRNFDIMNFLVNSHTFTVVYLIINKSACLFSFSENQLAFE